MVRLSQSKPRPSRVPFVINYPYQNIPRIRMKNNVAIIAFVFQGHFLYEDFLGSLTCKMELATLAYSMKY